MDHVFVLPVVIALAILLPIAGFAMVAYNPTYPKPPKECPFFKGLTGGPEWAGAAEAQAFFEVALGQTEPKNLEAWWARRHPRYQEMVALERMRRQPVPR